MKIITKSQNDLAKLGRIREYFIKITFSSFEKFVK
jgi:hypothetical protein